MELLSLCDNEKSLLHWIHEFNHIIGPKSTLECAQTTCNGRLSLKSRRVRGKLSFWHRCDLCKTWSSVKARSFYEQFFPKTPISKIVLLIYFWCLETPLKSVSAYFCSGGSDQKSVRKLFIRVGKTLRKLCSLRLHFMDAADELKLSGSIQTDAMYLFKLKGASHTNVKGCHYRAWTQVFTEDVKNDQYFSVMRFLVFLLSKSRDFIAIH
jgi:hypothetical protein